MEATLEAPETLEPIKKLSKDLRAAAKLIGRVEARYLVDTYYQYQEFRITSANQIRQQIGEPSGLLAWVNDQTDTIERTIKNALGTFAAEYRVGKWLQSICGIGPVISAGLLAELDIRKAPSAGHFWSFAGLTNREWNKGEKRPWNARLKTLIAFKVGESFVKVQNNPNDFYGKLFRQRKDLEIAANLDGQYKDEAEKALSKQRFGDQTTAKACYVNGQLPPAHVHARARRWTVKLFVSHLHSVMFQDFYGRQPPLPYVMAHMNHVDMIDPPNWPIESGKSMAELYATEPASEKPKRAERTEETDAIEKE